MGVDGAIKRPALYQLLDGLRLLEAANKTVRDALAAYCDDVKASGGEPFIRSVALTKELVDLLEAAIEDLEARALARRWRGRE